jgi:hypothetical protein
MKLSIFHNFFNHYTLVFSYMAHVAEFEKVSDVKHLADYAHLALLGLVADV